MADEKTLAPAAFAAKVNSSRRVAVIVPPFSSGPRHTKGTRFYSRRKRMESLNIFKIETARKSGPSPLG
jgi:hypothetical protein